MLIELQPRLVDRFNMEQAVATEAANPIFFLPCAGGDGLGTKAGQDRPISADHIPFST